MVAPHQTHEPVGPFLSHKDAEENGWHSRRHETRAEQDAARERHQQTRGREARRVRALMRWLTLNLSPAKRAKEHDT